MKAGILACFAAVAMTWSVSGLAQLDRITSREAAAGLKAALEKGSLAAVADLGRNDGFLGNPRVRIPLPDSMQRAEKLMRRFGVSPAEFQAVHGLNAPNWKRKNPTWDAFGFAGLLVEIVENRSADAGIQREAANG
jgi:hypothetical protein